VITFFATPKPFTGHIAVIQRNAITSWTLVRPRPEIVLVGDEQGTAEIATELGLCHIPAVQRNEYGTPLLNDIFAKAEAQATHDLLCYINADIVLLDDFMKAIELVAAWGRHFLMVGRRTGVHIQSLLNFASADWESGARELALRDGELETPQSIDYFAFARGLYRDGIPPFALGRFHWDNWLVWKARALKIPLVDATARALVIHQHHDYSHHPGGFEGVWRGEEARRNHELAGPRGFATIEDATHKLTARGVKRNFLCSLAPVRRTLSLERLLDVSRPGRHALGLRRANVAKLTAKMVSLGGWLRQSRQ
jgi:hypothetical protein